ncbi:MAG: potassium-transporting ATPase subunit KdpC [Bacteroidetes bacterium]|nr:potassium-transporting ATPase subunit KdpC [Bacteroidota bacterium]
MFSQLRPAIILTLALTLITGLIYPLAITGIAQLLFPGRANGSLIVRNSKVVGSELIGQNFTRPGYFRPRPSAAGAGYDAAASGGSNLGPTSRVLIARIDSLTRAYRAENPGRPVPIDMVTTSASGLDPDITPANAEFQTSRVARERGVPEDAVRSLVRECTDGRQFHVLGEPRVNVLRLNMMLDDRYARH